jgi:hypothetical protein
VARLRAVPTTLFVVAGLLAGCGANGPVSGAPTPGRDGTSDTAPVTTTSVAPEPPAGPPDPCELVTDAEAAAAGVTVHQRQLTTQPASPVVPTERFCIIYDNSDRYITVHVSEGGRADYDLFTDQHDIEADFRTLTGVGDAAHAIRTEAVVLVGDYVVRYNLQLYNQGVDPATQQDRVIALAVAGTAKMT